MNRNNKAVWILAAACSLAVPVAGAPKDEGFLVLRRNAGLEAMRFDGSERRVLRRRFSIHGDQWNISRDGKRVCFAAMPVDVSYISARSYRDYLFVLEHNRPVPQAVLSAYGEGRSDRDKPGVTGFGYRWPSFDASGRRVFATEESPEDYTTGGRLALHQLATREREWDSDKLAALSPLLTGTRNPKNLRKRLGKATLSSDGKHVLCEAFSVANRGTDAELDENDWKRYLIHFDLQKEAVEILASFDQDIESITWAQDSKRYAFSSSADGDKNLDIYAGELEQGEPKRLTHNAALDYNPIWNRSGTRLYWLSNRAEPKPKTPQKMLLNRLFSMLPDGTHQRVELSHIQPFGSARWAASLPSWRRYREKEVFASLRIKS
jgi:hypothetical protein